MAKMEKHELEKPIENEILSFLRTIGVYCWKNQSVGIFDARKKIYRKSKNPYHLNGVSDILGVIQGRFLAIEVKSKHGVVSDDQRVFIRKTLDEGGIAFVSRSVEQTAQQLLAFFPTNDKLKQFCKEYVQSKGMDH